MKMTGEVWLEFKIYNHQVSHLFRRQSFTKSQSQEIFEITGSHPNAYNLTK
jgi:hypothetical protein